MLADKVSYFKRLSSASVGNPALDQLVFSFAKEVLFDDAPAASTSNSDSSSNGGAAASADSIRLPDNNGVVASIGTSAPSQSQAESNSPMNGKQSRPRAVIAPGGTMAQPPLTLPLRPALSLEGVAGNTQRRHYLPHINFTTHGSSKEKEGVTYHKCRCKDCHAVFAIGVSAQLVHVKTMPKDRKLPFCQRDANRSQLESGKGLPQHCTAPAAPLHHCTTAATPPLHSTLRLLAAASWQQAQAPPPVEC